MRTVHWLNTLLAVLWIKHGAGGEKYLTTDKALFTSYGLQTIHDVNQTCSVLTDMNWSINEGMFVYMWGWVHTLNYLIAMVVSRAIICRLFIFLTSCLMEILTLNVCTKAFFFAFLLSKSQCEDFFECGVFFVWLANTELSHYFAFKLYNST